MRAAGVLRWSYWHSFALLWYACGQMLRRLFRRSGSGVKTSAIAIIILLALGGAAYWLQANGQMPAAIQAYLPAALTAPTAEAPAGGTAQRAGQAGGGGRGPSPVEVAAAATAELSDDIQAIGTLISDESVDIAAETSGRIVEILFADGAEVKAGDVLFKLDDALALAEVNDAKARLDLARTVVARNATLIKSRNIAHSTVDQGKTELALAESALALAEVQQGKLTIRAPVAGRTGFRSVSAGAYVQAGAALVHVEKIDRLKAGFSVPELYFARLAPGQTIAVTADAAPGATFEATVSAIDPLVDVNGRALRVRADLDNREAKLRPGMLVRITVKGAPRSSVTVPEAAIVPRGNGAVVFVAADEKAREAKVRTGKRVNGAVEILEGLKAGDSVIVAGNTRLSDGAAIAVVPAPAAN
jgi:membrane fusion protein, multidrug efflux system